MTLISGFNFSKVQMLKNCFFLSPRGGDFNAWALLFAAVSTSPLARRTMLSFPLPSLPHLYQALLSRDITTETCDDLLHDLREGPRRSRRSRYYHHHDGEQQMQTRGLGDD